MLRRITTRGDRERARRNAATRRWRKRVRDGQAIYPLLGDAEILDFLIRTRWLDERDAPNRFAVALTIRRLLLDMARGLKKKCDA
jgi:hypothetical protein